MLLYYCKNRLSSIPIFVCSAGRLFNEKCKDNTAAQVTTDDDDSAGLSTLATLAMMVAVVAVVH